MSSESKVHLFQDVAKHNTKKDCWLLVHGKVYNVTAFLDDHPGGDEVIINATGEHTTFMLDNILVFALENAKPGKDATNDFEDVGHSDDARDTMEKYYVGEIDKSSIPSTKVHQSTSAATSSAGNQDSGGLIRILQFLIPLLILGVAFVYRQFKKKEE